MSTATTIDAASLRNRKAQVFSAIALAKNLDASDYTTAIPITAGSGAPSHNALVTNEIYIRTDASDSDTLIYRAVDTSGTWEAIIGSEVTELLAAANAWTNTNDFSKTITGADELINADLSVNHATAVGKAIEATLIQATTARTSGTVAAFAASCTSLNTDSGGVYVDYLAQAPTDGGGTVTHTAFSIGAGHDIAIDFSAAATGESDLVIKDNLASALEIREGANPYLVVVTIDGGEKIQLLKPLDLDNTLDQDVALTAAGDGHNLTVTINHATADVEAFDSALTALTTARTGGVATTRKSSLTGLAGDTSGAIYAHLVATGSKATGSSTMYGMHFLATQDLDAVINGGLLATGQNRWLIPDNVAEGWGLYEGATPYLTVVTTDNSESIASAKRLTTTDGVASGTVRVVGGRAYSNTAAGSALTGSASETVLGSYSIPANTLKAGSVLTFKAKVKVTANNGATTLTGRCRLGATTLTGTVLYASAAVDTGANDIFWITGELISRAAPSAASAVEGMGSVHDPGAAGTALKSWTLDATNFATDGALLLEITGQWSAGDANSCQLEHLSVSIA